MTPEEEKELNKILMGQWDDGLEKAFDLIVKTFENTIFKGMSFTVPEIINMVKAAKKLTNKKS